MRKRTLFVSACCLLLAGSAAASFIRIDCNPAVSISNGRVSASVRLTNLGDEPAYDLNASVYCASAASRTGDIPDLQPGQTSNLVIDLGSPPEPGGIYSMVFRISYRDSGGKSYSALSTLPLVTDIDSPPKAFIALAADNIEIGKNCSMKVRLTPLKDIGQARITMFLPDELQTESPSLDIQMKNQEPAEASFRIRNTGANSGSTYLAVLVADTVIDGLHFSKTRLFNISVKTSSPCSSPFARYSLLGAALLVGCLFQLKKLALKAGLQEKHIKTAESLVVLLSIVAVEVFITVNLSPKHLLMDTTAVGGDTPAHNYIASHIRQSLFGHGRIVSWAGGWWCGFPMMQFYFALPYIITALADIVLPFNTAFKLVSVAGILILPPAAYYAAKAFRIPSPAPAVLSVFMAMVLFDHSHTMWGVNIYSTLAGMISNSLSFPIMLLFLGSAWRDTEDGKFRIITPVLLALVLASHFFTSIVCLITAAVMPLLHGRKKLLSSCLVLGAETALGAALMAWWLIPLVAKIEYTADFGTNWTGIGFIKQLPFFVKALSPMLLPALYLGIVKRHRAVFVFVWMFAASVLLFYFGYSISNVFVNVRLWPFVITSLVILEAAGLAYLLSLLPSHRTAVLTVAASVLLFGIDSPNHVPAWSKWNFEGLESKSLYPVFKKLVLPLKGTAGRLANDLCDENNMMGSSRIFELAPHLTGKPILEGGIVNSAAGSMFSYYIQSETSRNCAGFPTNVIPSSFNITNATIHLELFNVKHFIARWEPVRQAMHDHPSWRYLDGVSNWELFELVSNSGSYIFVPERRPSAVVADGKTLGWKAAGMEWIYSIASASNFYAVVQPEEPLPAGLRVIQAEEYLHELNGSVPPPPNPADPLPSARISQESVTDREIRFRTSRPGLPHIIKCTWYPNWKSAGKEHVYMVTPCFMMIIPQSEDVLLYYGRTRADITGMAVASAAAVLLLALASASMLNKANKRRTGRTA